MQVTLELGNKRKLERSEVPYRKSLGCLEEKVGRNMGANDDSVKDRKEVWGTAEEASFVLENT